MFGLRNDVNKHVGVPDLRYDEHDGTTIIGIVVVFTVFDFLIFVGQIKHAGTVTDTDTSMSTQLCSTCPGQFQSDSNRRCKVAPPCV